MDNGTRREATISGILADDSFIPCAGIGGCSLCFVTLLDTGSLLLNHQNLNQVTEATSTFCIRPSRVVQSIVIMPTLFESAKVFIPVWG